MSLESDLRSVFVADATLTGLVPAAQITWGRAPQDTSSPFVVLTRINTTPTSALGDGASGTARLDNVLVQASIYATKYADALTIAVRMRTLAEQSSVQATLVDLQPTEEEATDLYGQILQLSCWDTASVA